MKNYEENMLIWFAFKNDLRLLFEKLCRFNSFYGLLIYPILFHILKQFKFYGVFKIQV